jgi:pimeloyl-ACP methyl ester carboxylesterase
VSTFQSADAVVAYDDEGTGDVLLFVHGHPFNRSMWRPQLETFSDNGWRGVAPDLRGYGESTVIPGMTTLDVFAADQARLLDHLGVEEAVVVGLSMGGQIAMDFYRQFPQRTRALVLADTFAEGESPEGKKRRNDIADRLQREGVAAYADEELPKMVSASTIGKRPNVAEHVLGMMRDSPAEGAAAALRGRAERPDYVKLLGNVAVPVLVVVGRDDTYTPVAVAEAMHERLPHSTLVVVEDTGHMPNLERPDEFNRALGDFLRQVADRK